MAKIKITTTCKGKVTEVKEYDISSFHAKKVQDFFNALHQKKRTSLKIKNDV
ncbi:MAG: hypothetical protein H7320_16935 [Ferruginibacter sp.]|nr:hypothetical protein [Ferruginibacter sp.]